MNDPIPKRLVSFQFNADEQIRLIKEMLADRDEQRAGNDLEPGDALKLVELLDSVRSLSFLSASALREIDFENG